MALIKHPACKLSAVRFLNDPQEVDQHHFVTGSWEQTANSLHLWSASRQSGVALLHQQDHETGDVCAIQSLKSSLIATASSQGSISVYYADGQELKQVSERRVSSGVLTSLAFVDRLNAVLCAGEDGALSLLFIDKLSGPLQRQQVCQSPITCVDALPGSEVLCGNTAGCVKSVDSRSLTVTASLCHSLCPVTSVRRNPSNPHLIVSTGSSCSLCNSHRPRPFLRPLALRQETCVCGICGRRMPLFSNWLPIRRASLNCSTKRMRRTSS